MVSNQHQLPVQTRRRFLHGAAGAGVGLAAGGLVGAVGARSVAAAPATDESAALLGLAATAEGLSVAFYKAVLRGAQYYIDPQGRVHLAAILEAEKRHARTIRSLGGAPLQKRFYLPLRLLTDAATFVATGISLESTMIAAYLSATPRVAELGQAGLAAELAQLGAEEAQHRATLGYIAGLSPAQSGQAVTSLRHADNAKQFLAPFLSGGPGYVGLVEALAG